MNFHVFELVILHNKDLVL